MHRESFVQELWQPSFAWHGRVTPPSHSWSTPLRVARVGVSPETWSVATRREASSECSHSRSCGHCVLALVPGGQSAPLDKDAHVPIDPFTWLVEPFTLSRAFAVLQQARAVPCPRSPLTTPRREARR